MYSSFCLLLVTRHSLLVTKAMLKFAPEGYPFIIVSGLATLVIAFFAGLLFASPPFVMTLFMLYFFRDPERDVPDGKDLFVSPADGKVILITETHEADHLCADIKKISIFMSPFNVHVNRAPCDGKVKRVKHTSGSFCAAYSDEASVRNENIAMVLETRYGDVLVRQVAGFLARRAVCRRKKGDVLKRGERYGIIKFSSRLDIYLPKEVDIKVKLKDKVKAGETVIAEMRSEK